MEVVTYLTSTLIVVVGISLVIFGFWFDVQRRRSLQKPVQGADVVLYASASSAEPLIHTKPSIATNQPHSVEGFLKLYEPIESDLHVYTRQAVFGPVVSPITIHNGGQLMLFGTCASSVTVRSGGVAVLYGLVTGDVVNEGGSLLVHGTVMGNIDQIAGCTTVSGLAQTATQNI